MPVLTRHTEKRHANTYTYRCSSHGDTCYRPQRTFAELQADPVCPVCGHLMTLRNAQQRRKRDRETCHDSNCLPFPHSKYSYLCLHNPRPPERDEEWHRARSEYV